MPIGEEDVTTSLDSSPSESTNVSQEQPVSNDLDVGATQHDIDEPTPTTSVGSDPKPVAPDPVAEAIARLAKPEGGTAPAKVDKSVKEPAAPENVKQESESPTAKPKAGPTLDDPYAGWLETDQQRNMLKGPTRERINALHKNWKDAETHPSRVLGNEFDSMLSQHQLQDDIGFVPPDHLAGLVKVQAAINRSLHAIQQGRRPAQTDLAVYQSLRENLDQVGTKFGIQTTPAASAIAPLDGTLSPEYQDLIDVYGMPEQRVRLLAALEQSKVDAKPRAQAPQAQQQYAPPQQPLPEGVDMEDIHSRRVSGILARDGISADRMAPYQKMIEPTMQAIVAREFPGIQPRQIPAVFNAMSPKERADILIRAHTEVRNQQSIPAPTKQALAPSTRQPIQRSPMRALAPTQNHDPVESAIALLSRRNDDE